MGTKEQLNCSCSQNIIQMDLKKMDKHWKNYLNLRKKIK